MPGRLIILAALEIEANAISKALSLPRSSYRTLAPDELNDRSDEPFAMFVIGMRAAGLDQVELPADACAIALIGLSGGLDPTLACGDMLLDERSDPDIAPKNISRAKLANSEAIVTSAIEKNRLHQTTGAAAVDMESERVRAFAAARNLKYVGIRVIIDRAHEDLNPRLANFIDDRGRVKPMALIREIFFHPKLIIDLLKLARRSRIALKQIKFSARELIVNL